MKRKNRDERSGRKDSSGPGARPKKDFGSHKKDHGQASSAPAGGAFVFRDRSGKVHSIGGGRGASAGGAHGGARDEREERKPARFEREDRGEREERPHRGPSAREHQLPDSPGRRFEAKSKKGRPAKPERGGLFKEKKFDERGAGSRGERGHSRDERGPKKGFKKDFGDKGKGRFGDRDRPERSGHSDRFGKSERGGKKHGRGRDREDRGNRGGGGGRFDRAARGNRGRDRERSPRASFPGEIKLRAVIDKNRKGFAFLNFTNRDYEDAFLNPRDAQRFFHGDRVEATVTEDGEVIDLRVVEHRFRELVGRFYPVGDHGMVVYERKKAREEIQLDAPLPAPAKSRDWVRVKVNFHEDGEPAVTATVIEVYGPELPATADIGMVAAEYNLVEEHSSAAVKEAESFELDLDDPERTDLRDVPFITIDGETARDFDDAVYVERNRDGYLLWVAIADVSHYVTKGTALDSEAFSRGTSVYFPERAFHMLPRALSENLCSLNPNVPRLTMTAKIQFDREGKRGACEVMNTLIQSKRRATYNQIQAEWETHGKDKNWEYAAHFELYQLIRKARANRGSIDFDLPEAELKVDSKTGEPISILNRARLDAHRLIEEFMISANEAVTDFARANDWPFIYRVHDEPASKSLLKFQELAANSGVEFALDRDNVAESLNELITKIDGHPAQTLLNMALLRSMPQAQYTAVSSGHFGLASEGYTHFTSPIRRYPDLIVHRLLKEILIAKKEGRKLSDRERENKDEDLAEVAEHCSHRERIAAEAERESIKLKQVRIMLKEVGNEFDAKITGMNDNGMFVGLVEPFVEGMVAKESLDDDAYEFVEERMAFVGRRRKQAYRIGDPVRVQVMRVDIDLRQIDFRLVSGDSEDL